MSVIWAPKATEESTKWLAIADDLSTEYFEPLAEELDRDQRYPWESVKRLVGSGLAGLFVPKEFGGQGVSFATTCAVIERISRGCASTGAILTAYALGGSPLVLAGTDAQKAKYLGGLAAGEAVSFALTEVGAGSDAAKIKTTAVREGDNWRIKGEKIYIGNGGASRYYVVFALTNPDAGARGITAFMVDKEADGVVIDHLEDKMGIRGTQTSNLKVDTLVSDEDMLGTLNKGMRLAMQTLNPGRISVAAQSVGVALSGFDEASREAVKRETFGQPIIENQGIAFPLVDVATKVTAARMITTEAAQAYDRGDDVAVLGAMAKLYASEASHDAVDIAVQVFGGDGYCKPTRAERLYRDQRILQIYEGTSEIQRLVLGRFIKAEAGSN
jgi:alkylation response protein AidB-like acyl-CoA dehydrogenase